MRRLATGSLGLVLFLGCVGSRAPAPPTVVPAEEPAETPEAAAWAAVPGWRDDRHEEAWPALLQTCAARARGLGWERLCAEARGMPSPSRDTARGFFERWLVPPERGASGTEGLMTGYYEPLLDGSLERTARFRYPVYAAPPDLLKVPVQGKAGTRTVRRRRARGRLVPYWTRAEIDSRAAPLAGHELVWLDDPLDRYVLHVEGSGRVRLPDGSLLSLDYADQNGHPFRPLGRHLADTGELRLEEVTLERIRGWADARPQRVEDAIATDPSYVFFSSGRAADEGPLGAIGTSLVPGRSIAVDPKQVRLGSALWLDAPHPTEPDRRLRRLVFAHDTGGAIRGEGRIDYYWGSGDEAGRVAGVTKHRARTWFLPAATP